MQLETLEYQDEGTLLKGFYAVDEKAGSNRKKPAVLVCHDWSGINPFAHEQAKKLAELGYVGFALDMYGQGKCGTSKDEKVALMTPLMENRLLLRQRIQAALSAVKTLPFVDTHKIAAIGFCFGGLCVLDLARSGAELCGVVSFHGLLGAAEGIPNAAIKAKILALHGYDDPMGPPEQVKAFADEMTTAKADWQLDIFGQTMHGFTNPEANDPGFGTVYNPKTTQRAWLAMKTFLQEAFTD